MRRENGLNRAEEEEKERKVYDEISIPPRSFSLSLSLSFVFRVSSQVGSNEGTDL